MYDQYKLGVEGQELQLEHDGEMDGMELGPEGWEGEGANGGDTEFASYTQRDDPQRFAEKMAQLRVITAVYKFPVDEPQLKPETLGRKKIHVNACFCPGCGESYRQLADGQATLLGQVGVVWSRVQLPQRDVSTRDNTAWNEGRLGQRCPK